jgi:acetaldehyde dehydrogenase
MSTTTRPEQVERVRAAVLGPGNIGTDLLLKLRRSSVVDVVLMAGIIADSAGLRRAEKLGIETSTAGVEAVIARDDVELVFDATGARAHLASAPLLARAGKRTVDLTPAAVGPFVVPGVNLDERLDAPNVNLISCGGQATIPIVHALGRAGRLEYAEAVSTIASASAGPGTRQNIDEFTRTTARGISLVGGAPQAKAIIILNPADPPILMRNTVYATVSGADQELVRARVEETVAAMQGYVPGYRHVLTEVRGEDVVVTVEVEGAGDHLPPYAGNLDIITAAATRVGELIAGKIIAGREPAGASA